MTCDQCEKVLLGKKKLNNHKKSHKSSACKHCGIWIKVNSKLAHDKKCSGNTNNFSCQVCNYTSDQISNLKRHIRSIHKTSSDENVASEIAFNNNEFNETATIKNVDETDTETSNESATIKNVDETVIETSNESVRGYPWTTG